MHSKLTRCCVTRPSPPFVHSESEPCANAMCKFSKILPVALGAFILFALPTLTPAQSPFDALSFGTGIDVVGYSFATGWTFVPTADLRVIAVGCFPPVPPSSIEILFWGGTNQVIATYEIPINGQVVDVLYQSVDGLTTCQTATTASSRKCRLNSGSSMLNQRPIGTSLVILPL